MKEQLITFETAKLAKEKGFDELTLNLYVVDPDVRTVKANNNGRTNSNYIERKDYKVYSRPTQSLLQKWLRDKHFIYVSVIPSYIGNDFKKRLYFELSFNKYIRQVLGSGYKETYEEALEEGLIEALKLIKNEK